MVLGNTASVRGGGRGGRGGGRGGWYATYPHVAHSLAVIPESHYEREAEAEEEEEEEEKEENGASNLGAQLQSKHLQQVIKEEMKQSPFTSHENPLACHPVGHHIPAHRLRDSVHANSSIDTIISNSPINRANEAGDDATTTTTVSSTGGPSAEYSSSFSLLPCGALPPTSIAHAHSSPAHRRFKFIHRKHNYFSNKQHEASISGQVAELRRAAEKYRDEFRLPGSFAMAMTMGRRDGREIKGVKLTGKMSVEQPGDQVTVTVDFAADRCDGCQALCWDVRDAENDMAVLIDRKRTEPGIRGMIGGISRRINSNSRILGRVKKMAVDQPIMSIEDDKE